MAKKELDPKYLEGLVYRGATGKKVKDPESGRTREVFTPFERPLKVDDVLDWLDKEDSVVIVTSDGQKHTVAKKAAKKTEK